MPQKKNNITIQISNENHIINIGTLKSITDSIEKEPEVRLMHWIAKRIKDDNIILLNVKAQQKIMNDLKISSATVERAIKALKESEILNKDPELGCTQFRLKNFAIIKKNDKWKSSL
jgi:sensor domain CHASE-containing protein